MKALHQINDTARYIFKKIKHQCIDCGLGLYIVQQEQNAYNPYLHNVCLNKISITSKINI